MTAYTPPAEAVEAACRAAHPTRWEYRATAHPCEECATAVTAAARIIAAEGIERLKDALTDDPDRDVLELIIEDAARIARGEGS